MGLFDLFRGRKPLAPDELREALLAALRAGKARQFSSLCAANHAVIAENFPAWKVVPPGVREDKAATGAYAQLLGSLADHFAQVRGDESLWQQLISADDSNPVVWWPKRYREANSLANELRYDEAAGLLTDLLIDTRNLRDAAGNLVESMLPKTYGLLGCVHFQAGRAEQAVGPLSEALELCRRSGDQEGVAAYAGSLFEAYRYLGETESAAETMDRFVEDLESRGCHQQAEGWRRQAAIVRAGEPLARVVAVVDGKSYEVDEATLGPESRVTFIFRRNRLTLQAAERRIEQGKELAVAARFDEALAAFNEAAAADRFDPEPHYQAGWSLLALGRYADAIERYERVEELGPGWFHVRRDAWLARQLLAGRYDQQTFGVLMLLDFMQPGHDAEVVRLAKKELERAPDLAWLHLQLGRALNGLGQSTEGAATLREGLRVADEPDVRSCLLAECAAGAEGASPERTRMLEEARDLENGNLVAQATAKLLLRRSLTG